MQPELLVGLGALGVVNTRNDPRNLEHVLGDLRGHDVAIVAFGDGHETVGVLDSGPAQHIRVSSIADDLVALEIAGQDASRSGPRELIRVAVDDDDLVAGAIHLGRYLRTDSTASHNHELQGGLIIGRPWKRLLQSLLGFGLLRFPFTFMGVMAIGIGLWVLVYLAGHHGLDSGSEGIALATVALSWAFAAYVLIRRLRRGPQG